MGWQFRRSAQLFPGVRLNVTKNGVGLGFGGHGVRYSVHSSGRRTFSAGIPGTGLYWTETHLGRGTQSARTTDQRPEAASTSSPRPVSEIGTAPTGDGSPVLRTLPELAAVFSSETPTATIGAAIRILHAQLSTSGPGEGSDAYTGAATAIRDAMNEAKGAWPRTAEDPFVGLQPMPGFEVVVPLTAESALLSCACHLLACGAVDVAGRLIAGVPPCDETLLATAAAHMHAGDPAGALAVGVPVLDSLAAWMTGLIRAEALAQCRRESEAVDLLADLDEAAKRLGPPAEVIEVAAVLKARLCLANGQVEEACHLLVDVLAADPFDREASAVLRQAHDRLARVTSEQNVDLYDGRENVARLRLVLQSLERELQEAQRILLEVIEDLDEVAAQQSRVLGKRQVKLAVIKAELAALLAAVSGDPADRAAAEQCAAERDVSEQQCRSARADAKEATGSAQPCGEADLTTGADSPGTHASPSSDASDEPPGADAATLKKLYLRLIKRWHPDYGTDEEDRRRRTEVTMHINQLYAAKDHDGLQRLWEQGTLVEDAPGPESVTWLQERIEATRAEIDATRREIALLLESPLEQLRLALLDAAEFGRDLLKEQAADLDAEIAELELALMELREHKEQHSARS